MGLGEHCSTACSTASSACQSRNSYLFKEQHLPRCNFLTFLRQDYALKLRSLPKAMPGYRLGVALMPVFESHKI
eukprot:6190768-Pleurochrysis_carterae.AAC.1